MTNDEQEQRWPDLPPFKCGGVTFCQYNKDGMIEETFNFEVDQDSIKEIKAYIAAIEESMNG